MKTQLSLYQREPYSTGSRWGSRWVLLARIGHYSLALGIIGSRWRVALSPQDFIGTMLVSAMQIPHVGSRTQHEAPTLVVLHRSGI